MFLLNWVVNIGTGSSIASHEMNCRHNLFSVARYATLKHSVVWISSMGLWGQQVDRSKFHQWLNSDQDDVSKMNLSWSWILHRHPVASHPSRKSSPRPYPADVELDARETPKASKVLNYYRLMIGSSEISIHLDSSCRRLSSNSQFGSVYRYLVWWWFGDAKGDKKSWNSS